MNAHKYRSFAAGFALLLLLTSAAAAGSGVSPAPPAASQDPDIHVIKEAGLQFELPKGWTAETRPDGQIFLSFEGGAGTVTFLVADKYEDAVTGMKAGLKEQLTELKSDGEPKTDTHNGMTHIGESGSGLMKGVKITWRIDVLKARTNVTILTFGIDTIIEAHGAEYGKFVNSLKTS